MPRTGTEKERRQQTILMRLIREGRVSTQELSAEFGITDVAIRGDFDEVGEILKARDMHLRRIYGGAELSEGYQASSIISEGPRDIDIETYELLSEYVADTLISDWDQLLLDAGRTVDHIARQLLIRQKDGLRVITNSYAPHILELYTKGGIEVAQLGGTPVPRSFCYVDSPGGDDFYRPYWAGPFKAIITGAGFHSDVGLLVNNPHIIEMKHRFIKAASQLIIVLDHSKFGKTARDTVTHCGFQPDPWLIEYNSTLREAGKAPTETTLPLTIVTDIPSGQKATDIELSEHLTPQVDGKICIFETEIPLIV